MSRRRKAAVAASGVVVAGLGAFAAASCHYASELRSDALLPDHGSDQFKLVVVSVAGDIVELDASEASSDGPWQENAVFGLAWEGGYARVGGVLSIDGRLVRREVIDGEAPAAGTKVRLDAWALDGDPLTARGIAFEEITYTSPLGEFGAWFADGPKKTWAVMVHGLNAERREALRMLPAVVEAGLPALVVNYRNDEGWPANGDGYHRFGAAEWADVEGAVAHAIEHGAEDVVLVGFSAGCAHVMSFLRRSRLAGHVSGVVMDSPVLDFGALIDDRAKRRGLPGFLTGAGKWVAGWRYDIDWGALDYVDGADALTVPVLLFHGTNDLVVPHEPSDRLAAKRPDLVTYVRLEGAGHVRGWNVGPDAYEAQVEAFLRRVAGPN